MEQLIAQLAVETLDILVFPVTTWLDRQGFGSQMILEALGSGDRVGAPLRRSTGV